MIVDLKLALALFEKHGTREIVVSEQVFAEVLAVRNARASNSFMLLNGHHGHPRYRYFNKVSWNGILFVSFSNKEMGEHQAIKHSLCE